MLEFLKSARGIYNTIVVLICALLPVFAPMIGQEFFIDVFARTMIWAIAAISLNFIMGYGGMVSFGHAVYFGVGGYAVGILAFHGVENAYIQWSVGLVASAFFALIFGIIFLYIVEPIHRNPYLNCLVDVSPFPNLA